MLHGHLAWVYQSRAGPRSSLHVVSRGNLGGRTSLVASAYLRTAKLCRFLISKTGGSRIVHVLDQTPSGFFLPRCSMPKLDGARYETFEMQQPTRCEVAPPAIQLGHRAFAISGPAIEGTVRTVSLFEGEMKIGSSEVPRAATSPRCSTTISPRLLDYGLQL